MNKKTYNDVISGKSDNNINFNDFRNLIVDLGFNFIHQNGSHVQYYHKGINERMTIQNNKSKAKKLSSQTIKEYYYKAWFIGGSEMSKYSVFMYYDEQDQIFVASVPELQGCMAHGDTREEALKEIEIAEALWLESAKDMDIEIPEPHLFSGEVV